MNCSKLLIQLHLGDITKLQADVLVSSIHRSKHLSKGPLAGHISRTAGPTVQRKIHEVNGELTFKQTISCPPGDLKTNFKQILFACLYRWQDGNEEALFHVVYDCLKIASDKGYKSIAIPALGMGGLHYPPFEVSIAILEAITAFVYANPNTVIDTVFIALQDPNIDSVKTFVQCIMAFCRGMKAQLDMQRTQEDDGSTWFTIEGQDLTNLVRSRPDRAPAFRASRALAAASSLIKDLADSTVLHSGEICHFQVKPSFELLKGNICCDAQVRINVPASLKKMFALAKQGVKGCLNSKVNA
ncbi:hypothetical protein Btru_000933 [Bulinus truncatus]|nr:hypothetical protein Btru_000933 [Bulinus truncatus]